MAGILVRYGNQTRKIQGDFSRNKSFANLIREIKSKFDLDNSERFDLQVFDKANNAYFTIDKSEMKEVKRGCMLRIIKQKNTGSPKTKAKKAKALVNGKPPGVPAYSKADNKARNSWRKGSQVEMYSESAKRWQRGEVLDIFNDREGEWLVVRSANRTGEIQRFSNFIRVVQPKKKQSSPKRDAKQSKKRDAPKKKESKPKPKKVVLPTTQSKYKKKRAEKLTFADNEIFVKGNTQNVRKFVERAVGLLQGMEVKTRKPKTNEDDEKEEVEYDVKTLKFDTIHLFGGNRAMGAVVSVSELVKKCIPSLHQLTTVETLTIADTYIPLEIGLKEVTVERPLVQLKITLSLNAKDVDSSAVGYQEPEKSDGAITTIPTRKGDAGAKGKARGGRKN